MTNPTVQNTRLGIWLMIATTLIFAVQDGISRHLAESYNVYMPVMIRFWFFAVFVIVLATRAPGGLRAATRSRFPALQVTRGVLLVAEVCVMVAAFVTGLWLGTVKDGSAMPMVLSIAFWSVLTALSAWLLVLRRGGPRV